MGKVQSDSCSWWMKSLTLLSHCESRIQLLGHVLLKGGSSGDDITWKINSCNYAESLMGLHRILCVAKRNCRYLSCRSSLQFPDMVSGS